MLPKALMTINELSAAVVLSVPNTDLKKRLAVNSADVRIWACGTECRHFIAVDIGELLYSPAAKYAILQNIYRINTTVRDRGAKRFIVFTGFYITS